MPSSAANNNGLFFTRLPPSKLSDGADIVSWRSSRTHALPADFAHRLRSGEDVNDTDLLRYCDADFSLE